MINRQYMRKGLGWGAFALVLALATPAGAWAQGVIDRNHVPSKERVDPDERRCDIVNGNNLAATITNWTQTAQCEGGGPDLPDNVFYEWPKNTNRIYVALSQLWVGAEVRDENGEKLWIVDVADFRSNPVTSETWTFEPVKGYVQPGGRELGIAQSDEPTSWPDFWPDKLDDAGDPGWRGSWNGFFGKNIFNADQEFFFKAGDDRYDRYPTYFPDSTDLSRGGLGLIVETRVLAWTQILINDAIFLLYAVKNDGTKDLDKVGMTMWLADLVGGDSQDDIPFFDVLEDVAFMTDADGVGTEPFGSDPVGEAAIAFLETPGNATDRIDNDADGSTAEECTPLVGECSSPVISADLIVGEDATNGIDDNGNGLIDENASHIPFSGELGSSVGVGFADFIDNDADGERNGPVVTADMIAQASPDRWLRWPPNPENDPVQQRADGSPIVHLLMLDDDDLGLPFKDGLDNDDSCVTPTADFPFLSEPGSPTVTQAMVDEAAADPYGRVRVPGTDIILYDVGPDDLGKCYADGLDNDGDGAVDEGIDEGIDEMIDESRADGIDNDGDWNPLQDDNGLDGVAFSGDPGDQDGQPTTGAGTEFPGERNIDVTDISESDQIGITNAQIFPAGSLNFNSRSDRFLFFTYMLPGDINIEKPPPGENDLAISSGLFPLKAGQTERFSLSVQVNPDRETVLTVRDNALNAYLEDYQFAQAPITPEVRAVPGDGRVTLYWDSAAEESFDQFLAGLGLPAKDFEGYRVYRATDPAFLDALQITDGRGNLIFRKPIAQFDLIDEHEGFHPVDVNGVKFYLGNNRRDPGEADNGLAHMFVDSTVTNGIEYFYAVTAYDFGAPNANISPTESSIRIQRLADGSIITGPNVIRITPTAPVAGFEGADIVNLERTKGTTSSRIGYEIIDPTVLDDGRRFRIVFEDTLIVGNRNTPDTLTTKSFSILDAETGEPILARSTAFKEGSEFPILDDLGRPIGFRLMFFLEPFITLNSSESGWNNDEVYPITLEPFLSAFLGIKGLRNPADYRVRVVGPAQGMSVAMKVTRRTSLPARPTNVEVFRVLPDGTEVPVKYAFWDLSGPDFVGAESTEPATFSADPSIGESDRIIIIEPKVGDDSGEEVVTWSIGLNFVFADRRDPVEGEEADIVTRKPFLSTDEFEFTTVGPKVDPEKARDQLADIQVVPNPYVVTNQFERLNPFTSGRGPRAIKFINLPPQATVRIFTVSGKFLRELRRNEGSNDTLTPSDLLDGTLEWDLETKDGLTVSYGVYLYHVEAPGIGEKTGTFAIIK